MPCTIYLVGARASGKTTIGRALAKALGYAFVDTDHYLTETSGMTVAEVVAAEGWEGFRRRESDALHAVSAPGTVVATGGGMVLSGANREYMREHGTVFYLEVPVEIMAERLGNDPNASQRPTLTGRSIIEEIKEVFASREALYQGVAHHILDGCSPVEAVVREAVEFLRGADRGTQGLF
jgi:shikimate kinase